MTPALVLPLDVAAWADALDVVAARRSEMSTAGRRRAAAFTAAQSGAALAVAYRTAPRVRTMNASTSRVLVVLCPHFAPDTAPTGTVMTRIVEELVGRGYTVHVVTSLPWYRSHAIEPGWNGRLVRREATSWGSITRVHPFPGHDKTNLLRRALGFVGYSVLAGLQCLRVGGWGRRVDGVIAMSPPLTLGLTGWIVSRLRRAPLVFNIQDVFPDAAVETGAITNRHDDSRRRVARTSELPGGGCGHRAVRRSPRQRRGEDASGGR